VRRQLQARRLLQMRQQLLVRLVWRLLRELWLLLV
jgi:hypothetical protein